MANPSTQQTKVADTYYSLDNSGAYGGVSRLAKYSHISKRKAKHWLKCEPTYSLHKPIHRKFPTRKYRSSGIDDTWQLDLVEMLPYATINNNYKYIMTAIDIFSRFAYALPLKSKKG